MSGSYFIAGCVFMVIIMGSLGVFGGLYALWITDYDFGVATVCFKGWERAEVVQENQCNEKLSNAGQCSNCDFCTKQLTKLENVFSQYENLSKIQKDYAFDSAVAGKEFALYKMCDDVLDVEQTKHFKELRDCYGRICNITLRGVNNET